MTAGKVIRLKCLDCSGGSVKEVRQCPVTKCPNWEWRFGCRPATARRNYPEFMDPSKLKESPNA